MKDLNKTRHPETYKFFNQLTSFVLETEDSTLKWTQRGPEHDSSSLTFCPVQKNLSSFALAQGLWTFFFKLLHRTIFIHPAVSGCHWSMGHTQKGRLAGWLYAKPSLLRIDALDIHCCLAAWAWGKPTGASSCWAPWLGGETSLLLGCLHLQRHSSGHGREPASRMLPIKLRLQLKSKDQFSI